MKNEITIIAYNSNVRLSAREIAELLDTTVTVGQVNTLMRKIGFNMQAKSYAEWIENVEPIRTEAEIAESIATLAERV